MLGYRDARVVVWCDWCWRHDDADEFLEPPDGWRESDVLGLVLHRCGACADADVAEVPTSFPLNA